jgi:hypothetical protein
MSVLLAVITLLLNIVATILENIVAVVSLDNIVTGLILDTVFLIVAFYFFVFDISHESVFSCKF